MNSQEIAQKAVKFVFDYEEERGRNPRDVSSKDEHRGYDILSKGRVIEVKGTGQSRPPFIAFNQYNHSALKKFKNFWLYVVYNIKSGSPELKTINKANTQKLLDLNETKSFKHWEIPFRYIAPKRKPRKICINGRNR